MLAGFTLVATCLVWMNVVQAQWNNPLGGMLSRSCMYGFGISALRSEFHAGKKDRTWDVQCSRVGRVPHGENCVWTKQFINHATQEIHFMCNESSVGFEGYISGLYSTQDDLTGDRQWRIECCTSNNVGNDACVGTDYANNFQGNMNFILPPKKILHGVISQFDNVFGDRRWQFHICDIREDVSDEKQKKRKNSTINETTK